jgi:serine/threonine-protein kinase
MDPQKSFATMFRPLPSLDADRTIDATRQPSSPTRVDPAAPSQMPATERYEVKSVLGRGGMGEVRLCHDGRIGRDVAIKVAHGADRDTVRARFLREARVQGQLEHPAIVPVYDLETFDDGSAYFAMKRVRGTTLSSILNGLRERDEEMARRHPLRRLLAAFNSICLAVDFAHEKGVIHRDIKPGNIMLGNYGEVYLLDWGLAKVVGHDDADMSGVHEVIPDEAATVAGSVLGTPGYMAPEQIDAAIGEIGPATDVYALGAVLFEIVSLQRYVDAGDVVEATLVTLQGAERRPSMRAGTRATTSALDGICEKALARDPRERYRSARELNDAVDAFLSGEQDRQRRRELSQKHLDDAARRPDTVDGRARALRDLGSALALDPDNANARREIVRMLTSVPSSIPDAVQERIADDERARIRQIARLRTVTGFSFLPFILFVIYKGLLEPLALALPVIFVIVAAVLNWASLRRKETGPLHTLAHVVFLFGMIPVARLAGPFALLPGLFVAYSVELQMHPSSRHRLGVLVGSIAALAVAFLLDASGWVSPSYEVLHDGAGALLIHARMMVLDESAPWFLFLASVGIIVTPSVFIARARAALVRAEAKLHLQAWQLAQILPPDAAPDGAR